MIKNYSSIRLSGRFLTSKRVCTVMLLFFGYTAQSLAQVSNCVVPPANALLNTNNSVNTCGVFDTIDPADQHVIGLIDVASAVADAAGNGVAPRTDAADVTATTGMTKNPAWLIGNLGNLYGVSIDEDTAEFYAAASSNYASSYGFGTSQRDAILNYGTLGGGDNATGAGAIYKFDAVTGNPTLFATLPQATVSYTALNCEARAFGTVTSLPATGDQSRTNVGVGLGNIVWDTARDQLFAVNWEDGRIYRLDASGNILDAYDPDGTNNDIDAGFAGLDIPYGLALSPDGSSLFYGTMDRRVMSIDLTGAGGFPGTSSPVTVAGVNFNSFEDATETLHYTATDSVDPDLTLFISDLEFTPTGDLIIGTRSGCPAISNTGDYSNAFASSYNHDAETLIVQDNGAGLFNANVIIPNISYDTGGVTGQYGAPAQGNDGYGGVDYYVAPDGTFEYVFSYGDIIQESSPHGIAVFPSEDAADATPVNPLGGISYYTGADGLLDVKGVGGDVQVYQQFSCPAVGSWTGNVSEDTTGDSNGDTNLSNVTLMLFLDADGDGVADGPAIATTTTDGSGNYSFDNLLPNNYVVMQTQPAGLGSISEDEGGADNDQNEAVPTIDNKITGTVDAGETDSNNDFIEVAASGGSLCYGATEAAQQIFTIDPTSGDAVFLGTSGVGFIEAMAFVPIPNGTTTLYAANAGQLGTIALTGPNVGQFTALPSTFGSGLDDVDSLSYDPMTGIFYGVDRNAGNGAGAQQDVIFQIDLATGQAVANTLFPVDLVQNEAGTATYGEVDDIAIDPVTGVMYAVINAGSASAGVLAIIDPTDGSATTVGDLGAIDIESLSFDSVGNLFATDGASGVNSPTSVMFSVDKDTGEATFVGPVQSNGTGYTDVEALACLTDPVEYGSWTGNVAEDLDNDSAINDPGDAPIANVTITLFEDTNGDGQPDDINDPFLTTTTNGSGDYSFTNVFPGDYVAVQTQPAGFVDVVEDEGGADNDQPDNGTVNSIAGTVSPGENDDNNDFVEERLGSWTGNVSEDTTGDGNGDTPISGVTITLFTDPNGDGNPADGTPVGTQTTNGSGDYTFIDLLPGDYVAVETQPAGYDDVSENEGGADNDQPDNGIVNSIAGTVTSNETDINNDFVEELTPLPVAIGSFVFLDTDGDGSQQLPGGGFEPGITGVTVQLLLANGNPAVDLTGTTVPLQTTGADGLYFFNNLPEGDYQVQVTPPAGHLPTINQSSADDQGFFDSNIAGEPTPGTYISPAITLTANGEGAEGGAPGDSQDNTNPGQNSGDTSVDFGFVELGSWSGNVSEDTTGDGNGDAPISGVTVELFTDPNGDGDPADGVSVGTQTTDGSGDYAFTGLAPGDYVAVETQPANLDNISEDEGGADDDQPDNGTLNSIAGTVAPGEDDANNDFVEGAPAIRLEKSLVAFDAANDVNGNGFPDENDTLSYSFTVFNDGVTDLSNITISDAKLGLVNAACAPGTIAVGGAPITCTFEDSYTITAADVTAGYVVNTATTDGDSTSPVDNTPGTPVSDVSDTGTQPSDPENVTDEPTPETTNTTDPDPAIPNSSDPEDDPTTALLTPAGSWSGNVSEDTTGDGNGDAPISGVTVELFTDPNGDGDPADGVSVGTQTTDGSGDYAFTGLAPGDYVAVETQPANLDNISQDEGGVDDDENTATVVVNQLSGTVAPGEDDANNDFVEGAPAIRLEKSLVAFDAANDVNGNGFPDENDTLSYSFTVFNDGVTDLSNITISDAKLGLVNAACAPGTIAVGGAPITCTFEDSYTITAADVTAGYVVNTATTDGDSTSPVDNTPGTPVSDVSDTGTQPSDPENVTDEPTPETTNTTDPDPAIPNSSDPEDDPTTALLTPAGSWSGNVSEDTTGDGNGDAPISGVTVELFTDPNGDGDPADGVSVGTQTTDGSGDYAFTGLAPGDYVAVETQPANLDNISQDEGGVDDDENTATVVVNQLSGTVAPGEDDANNDFVEGAPAIRLEKSLVAFDAANDVNGNGFPDENDTLSYSFTVFNDGVTDLSNITISDAKLGLVNAACAPGTIAVGGAPITCTFEDSYTITAADVTAGYVVNTATTDGDSTSPVDNTPGTPVSDVSDTGTQPSDPENVTDEPTPETTNTTDPDPAIPNSSDPEDDPTTALLTPAGSWSGNVSEDTTGDGNGDAPISGVTVELFTDPNGDGDPADGVSVGTQTTDGSGDYAFTGLAPGDYVAVETQPANLDNISQDEGGVDDDENTATVVVNQLSGTVAPGEDDANNDFVEGAPAIRLEKSLVAFDAANDVNGNGFPDENDTLSYSFTVFNDGVTDLSNITISDAKLGLVNAACAPGTIAVGGAPITCTFEDSYTITAADVTAGYVVNTATTDGDSTSPVDNTPGTPVSDVSDTGTQPSDPENVTDEPTPETTNTTDPDPAIPNSSDPEDDPTTALLTPAGSWSGNVSEDTTGDGNGDAPISGVTVELFTDPNGDGDPADGVSVGTQTTDGSGDYAFTGLAPGDYVAVETQPANLDNISQDEGGVDDDENTATVVVNQLSGTVAPGEDDANNDFVEGAPAIRLEKSLVAFDAANDVNGNGFPDENDTLSYSFTVFNDGVTDLSNITISDAKLGLVNAACAPGTIAVGGAPITCTFEDSYTITAADVTAGYVVNTATTDGDSTSPVDNTPGTPVSDVSDTGTQPSDPENVTDEPTPETTNTTDPDPAIPNSSDPEDDPTTALLTPAGSWSGNVSEDTTGDGNGDAPISGVTVELFTDPNGDGDPADGVSVGTQTTDGSGDYAFTGLAPGDYVAVETQPANLDNISQDEGGVDDDENTATVVVNQLSGTVAPGEDDANNDFVEGAPAIRLEKSLVAFDAANDVNGNGFPDENDTLSYSFTVFNDGVTDLSNITISDAKLGLVNAACAPGTIAVGGAPITCTFEDSYTITAADVTAGYVVNTATTDGDSTSPVDNTPGTPVSDVSDTGTQPSDPENVTDEPTPETTNTTDPDPAIPNSSDPEDDPTTALLTPAGSWSGNVSEDTTGDGNGDAPISGVTVELFTDPNGDGDPADGVSVGTQTTDGSGDYAFTGLAPGDYVAVETQPANLDNISQDEGGVDDDENTATVVVNQLSGTVAPGEDDANNDFVEGAPAIRLEKSLVAFDAANDVNGNGSPDENDTLSYSFTVFNDGVTDLSNITISDAKLGLVNAACAPGTIAVGGAPITCTFEDSYTITAADVTAGYVVNTATTDGDSTSPVDNTPGTPVSDVSDTGTQPSDPENVTDEPTPETTNTTDPDPAIPNSSDPEDDPTTALLTPAGSWSGNVSEDTTGDGNGDAPISGVTVELFTDPNGDGDPADGVSVGTQTTDGSGDYAFTGLAPGDYVAVETQPANLDNISQDEGGVDDDENTATVVVNQLSGTVAPGEDDANNDFVEGAPAIRLEKSLVAFDAANDVNGNGFPDENDTLSYSFTVFNDGVTDLSNITISDAKLGLVNAACAPGTIAVGGAPITCTFEDSYTITAADVTAGYVVNTATTDGDSTSPVDNTPGTPVSDVSDTGTQPSDPENVTDEPTPETTNTTDPDPAIPNSSDPEDDPTTAIFNNPSISLIKSIASVDWTLGNNAFIFDENDEITYEFLVINDGTEDVAVAANAVSDGMLTNIVCIPATLTPGDSTTCTADPYVLTATDIANGGVENTADVTGVPVNCICPPTVSDVSDTGTDPDADPITDPETTETPNDFLVHPNDVNDPTDDPTTIMFSAVTTPATLSFVSSENLGSNTVEVKWKTDVETGNVGFMIYQRLDSGWEEVNEELIPSKSFSGIGSSGNSYQYTSTQFESSWYAIADVDDQEKVTLYGPYFVGKTYGAEEVRTEVMDWSNVDTSKQLDKQSIKDRLERLRKK